LRKCFSEFIFKNQPYEFEIDEVQEAAR